MTPFALAIEDSPAGKAAKGNPFSAHLWSAPFPNARYAAYRRRFLGLCRQLRYDARGLEHVPEIGPVLFAMNHTGWEEILFLTLALPRPLCYVGMREIAALDHAAGQRRIFRSSYGKDWGLLRRSLFRAMGTVVGPWVRGVLANAGYVPVGVFVPGFPPELGHNGLDLVVERLRQGHPVLVFPEGGYRRNGDLQPFKGGLGMIARACARQGIDVPVVPVAQWCPSSISVALTNRYVPGLRFGPPMVWWEREGVPPRQQIAEFIDDARSRVLQLLEPIRPGGAT